MNKISVDLTTNFYFKAAFLSIEAVNLGGSWFLGKTLLLDIIIRMDSQHLRFLGQEMHMKLVFTDIWKYVIFSSLFFYSILL